MDSETHFSIVFNIYGGSNQILPNATSATQNYYGDEAELEKDDVSMDKEPALSPEAMRLFSYINKVEDLRIYLVQIADPHIKVGSKAEITADAVPGIQYTGTVERISDATGSAFSLIPIDNATGNFVKVEQRVTVRIKLDENADVARLKGGYNVECIVEE